LGRPHQEFVAAWHNSRRFGAELKLTAAAVQGAWVVHWFGEKETFLPETIIFCQ